MMGAVTEGVRALLQSLDPRANDLDVGGAALLGRRGSSRNGTPTWNVSTRSSPTTRSCTPRSLVRSSRGPMRVRPWATARSPTSQATNDGRCAARPRSVSADASPDAAGGVETEQARRLEDEEAAPDLERLPVDQRFRRARRSPPRPLTGPPIGSTEYSPSSSEIAAWAGATRRISRELNLAARRRCR